VVPQDAEREREPAVAPHRRDPRIRVTVALLRQLDQRSIHVKEVLIARRLSLS
jgi:hypothetical protein